MQRPEFGGDKYYITQWTAERIAYVRHLASRGFSAAAISDDIYGTKDKASSIAAVCHRNAISLNGKPGRRPRAAEGPIVIEISERYMPAVAAIAARFNIEKVDVVHQLLGAVFGQGETFLLNLLDLSVDE
ncbi:MULTISPECIES: hypothetical protein [unclassified Bradyrhizobium]|uniref:hypothetical protein n=1 Tax=unclassified Bradyrhizobium TaxID=2631580 RepID=UPI002916A646|nr:MULTISPECIES: hypothetical protein [unclassified Bradyrhizobium]